MASLPWNPLGSMWAISKILRVCAYSNRENARETVKHFKIETSSSIVKKRLSSILLDVLNQTDLSPRLNPGINISHDAWTQSSYSLWSISPLPFCSFPASINSLRIPLVSLWKTYNNLPRPPFTNPTLSLLPDYLHVAL